MKHRRLLALAVLGALLLWICGLVGTVASMIQLYLLTGHPIYIFLLGAILIANMIFTAYLEPRLQAAVKKLAET